ncbi:hypothetical protein ISS30_05455 [bacterium]|nr:hypothetical protein [bacterium]
MRLVNFKDLTGGEILARPVYNSEHSLLLNKGIILDLGTISKLIERGYKYVYIEEPGTEGIEIEEPMPYDISRDIAQNVGQTFKEIQNLSSGDKATLYQVVQRLNLNEHFRDLMPRGEMRNKVKKLVSSIFTKNLATINTFSLSMIGSDPLSHAMDVTILSILLGKRFHLTVKELSSLGIATLLHDIGLQINTDICHKPQFLLSDMEWIKFEEHPYLGFKLLDLLNCFSLPEIHTVLQHHENQDGSGFPQGRTGNNEEPVRFKLTEKGRIFRWAEIVSVADRYVNYCAGNLTDLPLLPDEALLKIIDESRIELNAQVVSALSNVINIYPKGVTVRLRSCSFPEITGYIGVISQDNPEHPNRPKIILIRSRHGNRIPPQIVDLTKDPLTKLQLVI